MSFVSHTLKVVFVLAAALAALWAASTIAAIEPSSVVDENCPNSNLRFCVFVVV